MTINCDFYDHGDCLHDSAPPVFNWLGLVRMPPCILCTKDSRVACCMRRPKDRPMPPTPVRRMFRDAA